MLKTSHPTLTFFSILKVRRCSPRPWPTRRRQPSCGWWAQSWSRSTWATGPSWCGSCSGWRRSTRPPSCSSTRLTPSAPRGSSDYFQTQCERPAALEQWWFVPYGVRASGGWWGVGLLSVISWSLLQYVTVFIFVQRHMSDLTTLTSVWEIQRPIKLNSIQCESVQTQRTNVTVR